MNPYVFFVGCPRSGTTLLRRIADAHRELAVAPEQRWVPLYWERRIGVAPDGTVTHELAQRLAANSRFARLEVGAERVVELVDNGRPKHYARLVSGLFDLYGQARQKRLAGEKTPGYVRHIPTLHELWPHAKIVHLIRDGRDVALSLLDWSKAERNVGRFSTWSEDRLMTAALFWEWNVRCGREAGSKLGPELYLELRYEALIDGTEEECARLCSFLGIPYDNAMLLFHQGRTLNEPGLDAKKAWRPVTAGLRNWRQEMAAGDVARFEAAAGHLLNELGYGGEAAPPSEDQLVRAAHLRKAFDSDARNRRRPAAGACESERA